MKYPTSPCSEERLQECPIETLSTIDHSFESALRDGIPHYGELIERGSTHDLLVVQNQIVTVGIAKEFVLRAMSNQKPDSSTRNPNWLTEIKELIGEYAQINPVNPLADRPYSEFLSPARATLARQDTISRYRRANRILSRKFCAFAFVEYADKVSLKLSEHNTESVLR